MQLKYIQNFKDFIEIIKSKHSKDPLGRISLKNTKKTLSQPYCKVFCDMPYPIINRRDPFQWELQNFCMK